MRLDSVCRALVSSNHVSSNRVPSNLVSSNLVSSNHVSSNHVSSNRVPSNLVSGYRIASKEVAPILPCTVAGKRVTGRVVGQRIDSILSCIVVGIVFAIVSTAGAKVRAEGFIDFHVGAAFSNSTDLETRDQRTFPPLSIDSRIDFDPSLSLGVRFGGYLPYAPWFGMALDFSPFEAVGGPIEQNYILPISALFLFRVPLLEARKERYWHLQPYIGIGPSAVIHDTRIDLRPRASSRLSEIDTQAGVDCRLGLAWQFHKHVAIYAEYRLLYFREEVREREDDLFGSSTLARSEATILTQGTMIGVSFRF